MAAQRTDAVRALITGLGVGDPTVRRLATTGTAVLVAMQMLGSPLEVRP